MIFMLANYKGPNLGTLWIQLYINIKHLNNFTEVLIENFGEKKNRKNFYFLK